MKNKVENGEVIEELLKDFIRETLTEGNNEPLIRKAIRKNYLNLIEAFITNALQEQRDEGFKQGFEACRKDIREGKHLNCCYKKDLTNALNQQRLQIVEMVEIVKFNAKAPDDTLAMTPVERGMWYKAYYQACTDIINKIEFLTKLEK